MQKIYWFLILPLLVACTPSTPLPPTVTATPTPRLTTLPGTPCGLSPIIVPTPLAVTPGPAELDPSTGLHVTGKAQTIDLETYRLEVTGKVEHPLSLTYDDLRCMPKIEVQTTIVCKGNFLILPEFVVLLFLPKPSTNFSRINEFGSVNSSIRGPFVDGLRPDHKKHQNQKLCEVCHRAARARSDDQHRGR
jgi:hypothetical protein